MVKRAVFIHRENKRKKRKGIHSKKNKPKKYRGQGRWNTLYLLTKKLMGQRVFIYTVQAQWMRKNIKNGLKKIQQQKYTKH